MALTWEQKHLIDGLRIFGADADAVVGILSILKTADQQNSLMEWMCENKNASISDILEKTVEIVNGN